jgi:hypothetical protein
MADDGCQRPKHVVVSKKEMYLCSKDKRIVTECRLYSLRDYRSSSKTLQINMFTHTV